MNRRTKTRSTQIVSRARNGIVVIVVVVLHQTSRRLSFIADAKKEEKKVSKRGESKKPSE